MLQAAGTTSLDQASSFGDGCAPSLRQHQPSRHSPRIAIEMIVGRIFAVTPADLAGATRGRAPIAQARMVAMYLAHTGLGYTMSEVGRLFSRDRTTVAHACQVIEDRRDDPNFDRALDLLEWALDATLNPHHAQPF